MSEHSDIPKQNWPWPDSLDALVAASGNHTVLFENERVRVVQTRILPGQTVPVHTHRWPGVMFIRAWSDLVRRDHLGSVMQDSRQAPEPPLLNTPMWLEPIPPHSVENVGAGEILTVHVEIKSAL
ncbi:MAG: hypothetical protein LAP21_24270 [Acidobacteriia bacterium]|nr:hypothetical protein [Terriglobia bacterium]